MLPGPHLDAVSLLDLFEQERVNFAAGVPTVWTAIAAALEKEPHRWKLEKMRMVVGGSAVPEALIRTFDRFGLEIIHAWGMTETSPVGTFCHLKPEHRSLPLDAQYALRARQGVAVPFVDLRIVGDHGEDSPTTGSRSARSRCADPGWPAGT